MIDGRAKNPQVRNRPEPLALLDIGTTATDLVVATGSKCWMRSFPLGGHNFTGAIAARIERHGTVANPYDWAEEQKREGATSKHREDIMKAIKPVIDDLIGDVQKSNQYYENQNRGVKCKSVRGLGSTFKIPGLRVILSRQLGLEVARIDEFKRISVDGSDARSTWLPYAKTWFATPQSADFHTYSKRPAPARGPGPYQPARLHLNGTVAVTLEQTTGPDLHPPP